MIKIFSYSIFTLLSGLSLVKSSAVYADDIKKNQPSMAFLEYLADQVEVNGKLVGPIDMNTNEKSTIESVKPSTLTKTNNMTKLKNTINKSTVNKKTTIKNVSASTTNKAQLEQSAKLKQSPNKHTAEEKIDE